MSAATHAHWLAHGRASGVDPGHDSDAIQRALLQSVVESPARSSPPVAPRSSFSTRRPTTRVRGGPRRTAPETPCIAWPGIVVGLLLVLGSLEFVGPFEESGWKLAALIVPLAYIASSLWLTVTGVVLLAG